MEYLKRMGKVAVARQTINVTLRSPLIVWLVTSPLSSFVVTNKVSTWVPEKAYVTEMPISRLKQRAGTLRKLLKHFPLGVPSLMRQMLFHSSIIIGKWCS